MTDCIIWQGAKNNKGYGHLWWQGKYMTAHRWAYVRANGPIPEGLIVRHKCDNRACINSEHLIVGTYIDNMADAKERGRPIGRKSITPIEERILDIKLGLSDREIANKHKTSRGAIWKLRKRLEAR